MIRLPVFPGFFTRNRSRIRIRLFIICCSMAGPACSERAMLFSEAFQSSARWHVSRFWPVSRGRSLAAKQFFRAVCFLPSRRSASVFQLKGGCIHYCGYVWLPSFGFPCIGGRTAGPGLVLLGLQRHLLDF